LEELLSIASFQSGKITVD
jgi:ATP-binding cassette, subfamily C (CFTR/MRP), member 1